MWKPLEFGKWSVSVLGLLYLEKVVCIMYDLYICIVHFVLYSVRLDTSLTPELQNTLQVYFVLYSV